MRTRNRLPWLAAAGVGAFVAVGAAVRLSRRISFQGRTILITGGSRGLGLILARELAEEGANIAICARDDAELSRAWAELHVITPDVLTVPCDVTIPSQVQAMVDEVTSRFGSIDVLINNAGVISVGPMEAMTGTDYEEAMSTHFWGPLYATLAVLPGMRARGEGRIVNISSIGGKIAVPHLLPYSASKFALVGFSEGLRAELARDGILVTTVCPGLMRTGSPPNATFKGQHRKEYAWFAISDALPVASISALRAARRIIRAARYGEAEVILSLPAKFAVWFHGVFPGLTSDLSALANRVLPEFGGIGTRRASGRDSESAITRSALTALSRRATVANNEAGTEIVGRPL